MRRLFNKRQRLILAMRSGGRCEGCGKKLTKSDYHADHVRPWSKGGKTVTNNGAALCATCNLKKGANMKSEMREWQSKALHKAIGRYSEGHRNFLINAAPGAGKTFAAVMLAQEMMGRNMIDRVVVIAPRTQIVKQWAKQFKQVTGMAMSKITGSVVAGLDPEEIEEHIATTWQGVQGLADAFQAICKASRVLVIGDEVHHAALGAVWGDKTEAAFSDAKHALALTGTPERSDGASPIWMDASHKAAQAEAYDVSYEYAIQMGWCVPVTFSRQRGEVTVDWEGQPIKVNDKLTVIPPQLEGVLSPSIKNALKFEKIIKKPMYDANGDPSTSSYHADILREAYEKLEDLRSREYGQFGMPDAGALIIANSIEMADYYAELIRILWPEENPRVAHSNIGGGSERRIRKFSETGDRWIVSVNMISEGVDIPRLRVLVMLPNASTELYFRQAIGRIIRKDGRHGDPAKDNSRGYCLIPEVAHFVDYAKRIEEDMGEVEPPPPPQCPSCGTEGERPRKGKPCSCCGYEPEEREDRWVCSEWSEEGCGAENVGGHTCHACGMPRRQPYSMSIEDAFGFRDGALARGEEISEADVKESEAIRAEVQQLIAERGGTRLLQMLGTMTEEQYSGLAGIFNEINARKQARG